MIDKQTNPQFLNGFGLDDKESQVYMALLRLGSATIAEIAKEANLRRTHVYNVVAILATKGLVTELTEYKKKTYQPEDPRRLQQILEERNQQLHLKLPELIELFQKAPHKPEVIFYKGKQGFLAIADRSIDKAQGEILFISSTDYFHEVTTEEYETSHYIPKRLKASLPIRMLTPENQWARETRSRDAKELRQTKYLPENYRFKSSMLIYGDEVSLSTSAKEMIGIVIESAEINQMMRVFFEMAWNIST